MIVLVNLERVFRVAQMFGLALFLLCMIGYTLTDQLALGLIGIAGALITVAFSARPDGLVAIVRSIGVGLAEVGLVSLFLDLVGLRVLLFSSQRAYWITLTGLLLNIAFIVFEREGEK